MSTTLVNDSDANSWQRLYKQQLLLSILVNDSCQRLMLTTLEGRETTNQRDTIRHDTT